MKNKGFDTWTGIQKWSLVAVAAVVLVLSPGWGEAQSQKEKSNSDVKRQLQELRKQSRALETQMKVLQVQRRELEWRERQEEHQAKLSEMRQEVQRLTEAGNVQEAEWARQSADVLQCQMDLEEQARGLQMESSERRGSVDREIRGLAERIELLAVDGRKEEAQNLNDQMKALKLKASRELESLKSN